MQSFIRGRFGQALAGVLLPALGHAGDGLDALPGAALEGSVFLLGGLGLLLQRDELLHSSIAASLVYTPEPPGIIMPPVASW